MKDGRPYLIEVWAQDQVTSLTCFFSTEGLPELTSDGACELLEREGLVVWNARRSAGLRRFIDASGNELWSVNIVVGDTEDTFVNSHVPLRPFTHGKER